MELNARLLHPICHTGRSGHSVTSHRPQLSCRCHAVHFLDLLFPPRILPRRVCRAAPQGTVALRISRRAPPSSARAASEVRASYPRWGSDLEPRELLLLLLLLLLLWTRLLLVMLRQLLLQLEVQAQLQALQSWIPSVERLSWIVEPLRRRPCRRFRRPYRRRVAVQNPPPAA